MDPIANARDAFRSQRPAVFINEVRGIGVVGMPIEIATTEWVNWLIVNCKGIIYVSLPADRLRQLDIPRHTHSHSGSRYLYVAVDVLDNEMTTGISAEDRTRTIQALAHLAPGTVDFRMPGHITPRALLDTGVLGRVGLAEALHDTASAAGFEPGVVHCGVLTEDGADADPVWLKRFAEHHDLPVLEIADVIRHRRATEGWHSRPRSTFDLPYFDATALVTAPQPSVRNPPLNVTMRTVCVAGDVLGNCVCTQHRPPVSDLGAIDDGWAHIAVWPNLQIPTCQFELPGDLADALARIVAADHCATVPGEVVCY